jgi:GNAT superfamily N-acetyltransferase
MRVAPASSVEDWADVERLIRAYLAELPFPVDFQDLDAELAELPAVYGPPAGVALLMADDNGTNLGVVAVRPLASGDAEMKRMYLDPAVRGRGHGQDLAEAAVAAARSLGYRRLLLDTVARLAPANAVYEGLGFVEIEPYRHNPLPDARYFALDLGWE